MSVEFDFTSATGLREYLSSAGADITKVDLLTGGFSNFVYRVTWANGEKLVYKHAQSYLSAFRNFEVDQDRITFEAAVLSRVSELEQPAASNTHAAVFKSYLSDYKLLCMAEGGDRNLKNAYTDETLNMHDIGVDLATWLACLHSESRSLSVPVPDLNITIAKGKDNNYIALNAYRLSYNDLHTALSKYGHDVSIAEKVNSEFGRLLETDQECHCHGDFWPGNILVQPKSDGTTDAVPELTVVDWEMSRRGISATDVAQFAAEAFLLDHFKGGRGLRESFLTRYVVARGEADWPLGKQWVRRMAVHWAVHVAFWPTWVAWADEEGTKELVDIGVKTLKLVLDGDGEGLKGSELFSGLEGTWDAMIAEE